MAETDEEKKRREELERIKQQQIELERFTRSERDKMNK
jgi:hypothetical protein